MTISNDGSVIFAGDFQTMPTGVYAGGQGIMIIKYDAEGSLIYSKTLARYGVMDFSSVYGITFDNAEYLNMIGYFISSLKYFNSSNAIYKLPDFSPSFFIAHFPDKP